MKSALKTTLIFLALQIAGAFFASFLAIVHAIITTGYHDFDPQSTLAPAMLFEIVFVGMYCWNKGYFKPGKAMWAPTSARFMVLTLVLYVASVFVIDFIGSRLQLPNLVESDFEVILSSWLGVFIVGVAGPVIEELIFRRGVMHALLKRYSPGIAIVASSLIFGVIHFNPAQIFSASLFGLVLGWLYYRTGSLWPSILMHVVNNSLSLFLMFQYPEVESLDAFLPGALPYVAVALSVAVAVAVVIIIHKQFPLFAWSEVLTPPSMPPIPTLTQTTDRMKQRLNVFCLLIVVALCASIFQSGYWVGKGIGMAVNEMNAGDNMSTLKKMKHAKYVSLVPERGNTMFSDSIYNKKTHSYAPSYPMHMMVSVENPKAEAMTLLSFPLTMLELVMLILAFVNFILIIAAINRSEIFIWKNVSRLRWLGGALIVSFACTLLKEWIGHEALVDSFETPGYASIMFGSLSVLNVVLGLASCVIAEVFAIGLKMQEDQELTI